MYRKTYGNIPCRITAVSSKAEGVWVVFSGVANAQRATVVTPSRYESRTGHCYNKQNTCSNARIQRLQYTECGTLLNAILLPLDVFGLLFANFLTLTRRKMVKWLTMYKANVQCNCIKIYVAYRKWKKYIETQIFYIINFSNRNFCNTKSQTSHKCVQPPWKAIGKFLGDGGS